VIGFHGGNHEGASKDACHEAEAPPSLAVDPMPAEAGEFDALVRDVKLPPRHRKADQGGGTTAELKTLDLRSPTLETDQQDTGRVT